MLLTCNDEAVLIETMERSSRILQARAAQVAVRVEILGGANVARMRLVRREDLYVAFRPGGNFGTCLGRQS